MTPSATQKDIEFPVLFIRPKFLERLENQLNQIRQVTTDKGNTVSYRLNFWWNS